MLERHDGEDRGKSTRGIRVAVVPEAGDNERDPGRGIHDEELSRGRGLALGRPPPRGLGSAHRAALDVVSEGRNRRILRIGAWRCCTWAAAHQWDPNVGSQHSLTSSAQIQEVGRGHRGLWPGG